MRATSSVPSKPCSDGGDDPLPREGQPLRCLVPDRLDAENDVLGVAVDGRPGFDHRHGLRPDVLDVFVRQAAGGLPVRPSVLLPQVLDAVTTMARKVAEIEANRTLVTALLLLFFCGSDE